MFKNFTYAELVERCGEIVAIACLNEIENAAYMKATALRPLDIITWDPEVRLAYAARLQDYASLYTQ